MPKSWTLENTWTKDTRGNIVQRITELGSGEPVDTFYHDTPGLLADLAELGYWITPVSDFEVKQRTGTDGEEYFSVQTAPYINIARHGDANVEGIRETACVLLTLADAIENYQAKNGAADVEKEDQIQAIMTILGSDDMAFRFPALSRRVDARQLYSNGWRVENGGLKHNAN